MSTLCLYRQYLTNGAVAGGVVAVATTAAAAAMVVVVVVATVVVASRSLCDSDYKIISSIILTSCYHVYTYIIGHLLCKRKRCPVIL